MDIDNLKDEELAKLNHDQLDAVEAYQKNGKNYDGLPQQHLDTLQKLAQGQSWPDYLKEQGLGAAKAIGTGLAKVPGAVADSFNPTTQMGAEPDLSKGVPESWKGVNLVDPTYTESGEGESYKRITNATAPLPQEDTSFSGQIGKKIGWEPQNAFQDYLSRGATGAGAAIATGGRALFTKAPATMGPVGAALYQGALPAMGAKAAGDTAAALGASPDWQRTIAAGAGYVSPSIATRIRTPLPVSDTERLAATKTLNDAGVKTTASQDTGRTWLKNVEGGKFGPEKNEEQAKQFTTAATRPVGSPTEAVTIGQGGSLPAMGDRVTQNLNSIASRNSINQGVMSGAERANIKNELKQIVRDDPRHVPDVLGLIYQHTGWAPNRTALPANEEIHSALYAGARNIPGDKYQTLRSQFINAADKAASRDPTLAQTFRKMAGNLDRAMDYSTARQNPNDIGAFNRARSEEEAYRIVKGTPIGSGVGGPQQLAPNNLERSARKVVGNDRYNQGGTPYQPLVSAAQKALPQLPDKDPTTGWHYGLRASALGALGALGGAGWGMLHGYNPKDIAELALGSTVAGPVMSSLPLYARNTLATTKPGQAYFRNQAVPSTAQNAAARQRNAIVQSLMAGAQQNPPEKKKPLNVTVHPDSPTVPMSR